MDNSLHEFLWLASSFLLLACIAFTIFYLIFGEKLSQFLGFSFLASILIVTIVFNAVGPPPDKTVRDFFKIVDWTQIRVKGEQEFEVSAKMIFRDGRFIKIVPEELKRETKTPSNLY